MSLTTTFLVNTAKRAIKDGALAAMLSGGSLAARGKADTGSALAPINAPAHIVHGDESLQRDEASLRHTLVGAALHTASAMLWAGLYHSLQARRRQPSVVGAVVDAAAVTAIAAVVDLKLVPERLTPGFQHRLSTRSLWTVYATMALGLAMGGIRSRHDVHRDRRELLGKRD